MTAIRTVNAALRSAGCKGYSAVFIPAEDGSMDDSIDILLHGQKTSWALQIGHGYVGVNEYGYENGELDWVQDHGIYKTTGQAAQRLCNLLKKG